MLPVAQVDVARLTELVTNAWRMPAPDALVGDVDEADPRVGRRSRSSRDDHRTAHQRADFLICAARNAKINGGAAVHNGRS